MMDRFEREETTSEYIARIKIMTSAELDAELMRVKVRQLRDTLPQDRLRVIHGGLCGGKDQPDTARRSTADLVLVKSRERSITST